MSSKPRQSNDAGDPDELRTRALEHLRKQSPQDTTLQDSDAQRALHELQVHQIELEMQNIELVESRNRAEELLEKYTQLYNYSPVGYFSLNELGDIRDVNLTGASLLGTQTSRLMNSRLPLFLAEDSRPVFQAFLEEVFTQSGKKVCEAMIVKEDGSSFWADFHASSITLSASGKWCQVAVSDISSFKRAKKARQHLETLTISNHEMQQEIIHRQEVEKALIKSEGYSQKLLEQARHMQEQLRHLTHRIVLIQEDERKQISRGLHDHIAQILAGINLHLGGLKGAVAANDKALVERVSQTQQLVENSISTIHRFAVELRPPELDDIGLSSALTSYVKEYSNEFGIHVHLTIDAAMDQLDFNQRTAIYRVAQAALSNTALHAKAGRVDMICRKDPQKASMEIRDDGVGFDVDQMMARQKKGRLGILGMQERVEMLGGSFHVTSSPDDGTTILAKIPCGEDAQLGDLPDFSAGHSI